MAVLFKKPMVASQKSFTKRIWSAVTGVFVILSLGLVFLFDKKSSYDRTTKKMNGKE